MRTIIHTPTPDPAASTAYYEALGFELRESAGRSVFCDSQFEVEVNADRKARAGLRLIQPSWSDEIAALDGVAPVHDLDDGHVVVDPSNVWIYLTEGDEGEPERSDTPCKLGSFAGLSLETGDLERSAAVWGALGFKTEADLAASWVTSMNADGFGVTWMRPGNCPHLFFNPGLTFFNSGKNLEIISAIRDAGVEIAEEITVFNDDGVVDNVIVRDPGGYGAFVFND